MNIILGTVQIGTKYGLFTDDRFKEDDEIDLILKKAIAVGINEIDTASAYGDAEDKLKKYIINKNEWKFNTKIINCSDDIITDPYISNIEKKIYETQSKLQTINIVYIHNPKDLYKRNSDKIFKLLENLKKNKIINKIGCSVYDKIEIDYVKNFSFDNLQIPINIIDQRLLESGILENIKKNNIEIYARSVFLQGLLLNPNQHLPKNILPLKPYILSFNKKARYLNVSNIELALNFVRSIDLISKCIVGVQNYNQFNEIIKIPFNKININDFKSFRCDNNKLLDPRNW